MAAAAARLSSAAAIMLPLLAANDGSGAGVAAFTAIHSAPAAKVGGARIPPAASTALSYMSGGQGSERLPKRTKSKVRPSKKNHKAAVRGGGGVSKPRGLPTTEEELAVHVQSVFADLEEFSFGAEEEDEDGDDDDEPCVLEDDEGETAVDESALARKRQLDSCRKLDRHSALVLNADYQPLRMLPLSTWSWQTTIKAVLTGKAVVVDVYPDVYVRAVSLDMPVPSVIALHEYAPHGKSVSHVAVRFASTATKKKFVCSLGILPIRHVQYRSRHSHDETSSFATATAASTATTSSARPTSASITSNRDASAASSAGRTP